MRGRARISSRVLAATIVATTAALAAPALGDQQQTIAEAELKPSKLYPKLEGRVELVVLRYDAEVRVAFRGSPRRADHYISFWLSTGGRKAWSGGGFRAFINPRGVSAVIPGRRPVAKRHARQAREVILTLMSEKQAIELEERGRRSGWKRKMKIAGKPITRGFVVPCPGGTCAGPGGPVPKDRTRPPG